MISVIVADDQAMIRAGLRMLIDAEDDMTVLGEASTGREAIALARQRHPDIVLMDIQMPDLDGLTATATIRSAPETASTRVIVLTTFDTDDHIINALRNGASSFLRKDFSAESLHRAIRAVHEGDALFSAEISARVAAICSASPRATTATPSHSRIFDELTPRELEVLRGVARGESNNAIAATLHIGAGTVKTHVSRILGKLGVQDRVRLVVLAYENGLIVPGDHHHRQDVEGSSSLV